MTLRYSQKTGDLKGDATVWNTARNGSGSDQVPAIGDWGIIQTGHTITQQDNGFFPHMMIEVGGTFDQAGYQLLRYGSFLKNGTYICGGGFTRFMADGIIRGMSEGEPFFHYEVAPGVVITNEGGSKLESQTDVRIEGTLYSQDHGVDCTPAAQSRVSVPDHANLEPEFEEAFSIYARVRFDTIPAVTFQKIVRKMDAVTDTEGYKIEYDPVAGRLRFLTNRIGTDVSASHVWTPELGVTYSIVGTRATNGILRLYIDHDLVDTSSTFDTGVLSNSQPFFIGNDGLSHPFEGTIYEVQYWDGYQLTQSDVTNLLEGTDPGTAPELNLQMNEGTGTAEDSANSHDGTLENSAAWEDPYDWRVRGSLVTTPISTVEISSGEADVILYHGEFTVHDEHIAVYRKRAGGTGTLTGLIRSSSYHTTEETYTVDSDAIVDDNINSIEIQRNTNKTAQCDIMLENTPKVSDYILGTDKLIVDYDGETIFKGTIQDRSGTQEVANLTAMDNIYDLRKRKTLRTLYGNLSQWIVSRVSQTNKLIRFPSGVFFYPIIDCTFLDTYAKQLDTSLQSTLRKRVGSSETGGGPTTEEYVSQPYSSLGGDILRFAVYLYNNNEMSPRDGIRWAIWDMDPESLNYNTEIVTGTLDVSSITPGTGDWITYNVIANHGRIPSPLKCKLILGGEAVGHWPDTTDYMEWVATYIALNSSSSASELVTTTGQIPIESNLTQININDDQGERSGIMMCFEIENENDWRVKVDPAKLGHDGSLDLSYGGDTGVPEPSFANITRQATSILWDIARLTAWYKDNSTVNNYVEWIVNEWGRYWFDVIDVSALLPNVHVPFLLIEGSVGLALEKFIETWGGEYWHDPVGNDTFKCYLKKQVSSWSSYSEIEQTERTIMYAADTTGWDNIDKYRVGRLISGNFGETAKYKAQQLIYEQKSNLIPTYTDYAESEPFLADIQTKDNNLSELLDYGEDVITEMKENLKDVRMSLDRISFTPAETLISTNELIKAVDSRNRLSDILRLSGVNQVYAGGGWTQKFNLSSPSKYVNPQDEYWWVEFFRGEQAYERDNLKTIGNIDLSDPFVHSLEVNDLTYSDGDDTYWILLGGSDANPSTKVMQETDASYQLIGLSNRVKQGDYGYVVALFTEQNILGEWDDVFDIKEIGLYKGAVKPAYGATLDARKVIQVPAVAATGYASDLVSAPSLYRAPVKFLRNSQFTVTFGHTSSGT